MSNGWNGPPCPDFFVRGEKSREGDFTSDHGSYEGKFKNRKFHGWGHRKYKNGMSYEPRPNWKNGVRHGQIILTYSNGDVYKGEFNDGKRSGRGCLTCRNGNIFIFKDDLCTVKYDNGDSYFGQVKRTKETWFGSTDIFEWNRGRWFIHQDSWIESGYERVTKP